ncbi:ROK family transcriptional regulator [Inconstantimicrobium mannanitabidum]|uniref:ArsR family transcriptional regulator n=1 Tax=Inconstantimicrobium mannanitabidum TaxID=1604901 RepID=A0ACB5RD22_9CLOT|nr:ROK family transcriptional regulator [Clostridium sp. TW13]GKX67177.1 ArsR family transcriptional regulator [Clostridium sp. TW13]
MKINHSKIKETNRKRIIKLLLEENEITKLDISRELDISITTVSTNINELKEEAIVEDVRSVESTGGRKAIAIRIDENCRYSMGVALTPKHIKISLVNLKKKIVESMRVRHNNEGMENIINLIKENIEQMLKEKNISTDKLLGIGFSIPGIVDSDTGVIKYCYFLGIKSFDLKQHFEYLNTPIYVDNEANLSAFYEFLDKKHVQDNLLYVSITDGLGLGIVINGKIYRGNNNASGEMGHMKIEIDGKQCKCGSRGCLEGYVSKNALVEGYNEAAKIKILDIDDFEQKYLSKDDLAIGILHKYLKNLALGISNLIMILDPNSVIIGGDINDLLKDNMDDLRKFIYKDNLFTNESNCNIKVADFTESYLLGAAMLPIEEFLEIK